MRKKWLGCAPVVIWSANAALGAGAQNTLYTSSNWAGYFASASSGNAFTDISSTWVIPAVQAPSSGTTYTADWVGLDGFSDTTVEQCGTLADITSGQSASYFAWYELYPASLIEVPLTVHPGDTMFAETTYEAGESSNNHYAYFFDLVDQTTGKSYTHTAYTSTNAARSSAEWIAEAPSVNGSISTMANFDNVTFANDVAALNGGSDASLSSLGDSEIQLVQNGSYASLPSPLNVAGEAFNVNYGPGVPNFTWDNAGNPIGVTAGDGKTWDIGVNNNWNSGTNATFYSDGTNVTFNDSNNGRYSVTLNATVQPASVTVSASGNYTISGSGSIAGSGSLAKSGGGTLTLFTSNTYTGGTTVSAGKLIVAASGALPDGSVAVTGGNLQLATGTGLAQVKSLSLTGSGSFDVTNNALSVADPGGAAHDSTFASLLGWVKSGAITSTAGLTGYGVGIVDGNDGVTDTPVSLNTIEVAYTLYGDANLDGKVDATDFSIFAPNFGLDVTTGWEAGDFNYDGKVDATDFSLFAPNFGFSATGAAISLPSADYAALDAFAAANGLSLTSVPEPAATTLLIAATGFLLRRSRFRA